MATSLRVLMVEDSEDDAELLLIELRRGGFDVEARRVDTPAAMTQALDSHPWDVVLSDHNMPRFSSPEALEILRAHPGDVPFIIVSGSIGEDVAVSAMKAGAHDYIMKDRLARLVPAINRELREAAERRRRREAEHTLLAQAEQLRIARQIQRQLFPETAPAVRGFDIAGASFPAEATGGDYYDFLPLPDGALALVIGDVTGHGLGPALLMADIRAYLRTLAGTFQNPAEILTRAAALLQPDLGEDRFVTLLFARLHPVERTLVCLNAGHPPAYVLDRDGRVRQALPSMCPALGLVPGAGVPAPASVALQDGDCVLLLTDGVLESVDERGEDFGLERALKVVRAHAAEPAAAIVAALCEAARRHAGSGPQNDDITAIVARVGAPAH
jgi:serine phosphatase RsbU (regulator of sigma subunit)